MYVCIYFIAGDNWEAGARTPCTRLTTGLALTLLGCSARLVALLRATLSLPLLLATIMKMPFSLATSTMRRLHWTPNNAYYTNVHGYARVCVCVYVCLCMCIAMPACLWLKAAEARASLLRCSCRGSLNPPGSWADSSSVSVVVAVSFVAVLRAA